MSLSARVHLALTFAQVEDGLFPRSKMGGKTDMLRIFTHRKRRITQDQIAGRAYEIWQARGCPDTDGGEDWQSAESQLAEETSRPVQRGIFGRIFSRIGRQAA